LLEDIKNELKKSKWIDKGTKKLADGRNVKVIESSFEGLTELVYVEEIFEYNSSGLKQISVPVGENVKG